MCIPKNLLPSKLIVYINLHTVYIYHQYIPKMGNGLRPADQRKKKRKNDTVANPNKKKMMNNEKRWWRIFF